MQRFLLPALAAVVVAGGVWLAPVPASAQNYDQNQNYGQNGRNYRQNNNGNGATAWGDPWMNENDFDYNRRHWLPGPGDNRQGYNNENWNQRERNYGRNNENYDRRDQGGNNWNRQGRDEDRYDRRYQPNDQYGLGRNYRPESRYPDDDDE